MPVHPADKERFQGKNKKNPFDRNGEATKMLELLSRQEDCATLLRICSKAAQAVIKRF